jgi:hypothetical protein
MFIVIGHGVFSLCVRELPNFCVVSPLSGLRVEDVGAYLTNPCHLVTA